MIVQRELLVVSRRRLTYWARFAAAGTAIILLWQNFTGGASGHDLFVQIATLAFVFCVADGVRRASASIAEEAAGGTVGFLLLTPLAGQELFLGKYASVMIAAVPMGMAVVPVFAVSILLGGVSGSDVARAALAMGHGFSIAAAVGVMSSANNRNSGTAMAGALFGIGVGAFVGGFFGSAALNPINPVTPFLALTDFTIEWGEIVFSVLLWQGVFFWLLREKGRKFPEQWRAEEEFGLKFANQSAFEGESIAQHLQMEEATARAAETARWVGGNPIEWLTLREVGMQKTPWIFTPIAAFCGALAILTPFGVFYTAILTFGLAIFLCVASARTFAAAKRSAWLELIVTTPIGFKGLIQGNLMGLRRLFLWPALIIFATGWYLLIVEKIYSRNFSFLYFGYLLLGVLLLFLATPWIGMWMGLKAKTPFRAVLATMALVLIVPRIGICALDAPYFIVTGLLARRAVRSRLQRIVSERFSSAQDPV